MWSVRNSSSLPLLPLQTLSLLQCGLSVGCSPSGDIHLLQRGVLHGCSVDMCSIVVSLWRLPAQAPGAPSPHSPPLSPVLAGLPSSLHTLGTADTPTPKDAPWACWGNGPWAVPWGGWLSLVYVLLPSFTPIFWDVSLAIPPPFS